MFPFFFGCVFGGLSLLAIGLQRTYNTIPLKELKRRARAGDPLSQLLYRPVSYGMSLQVLLWLLVGVFTAAAFVLFAHAFNWFVGFLIILFFIWLGFLWLPSAELTSMSHRLAAWCTPTINWLLGYLHGPFERIGLFVRKRRPVHIHSGLYEKEDLVELLERQRHQPDNRIPVGEITLLQHALQFGDKFVTDAMIPRRAVRLVSVGETIGPILMDELHDSGHSRFPVFEGTEDHIVGTLFMRDLITAAHGGQVGKVARPDVFYVHEDFTLYQALQAFLKTKHHLFIVVNSFEEFVGIITIEDILEQVIGQHIVDEFDAYDDLRAVASAAAKKDHEDHKAQEPAPKTHESEPVPTEPLTGDKPTEVVE